MEATREVGVLRTVANETRIELDRLERAEKAWQVGDESVRDTAPAEELLRYLVLRLEQCIGTNRGGAEMTHILQPNDLGEIQIVQPSSMASGTAQVCPCQPGSQQLRIAQVGSPQVCAA